MGHQSANVFSVEACKALARSLRQEAEIWDNRASFIESKRGKLKPIQDRSAVLNAALRVYFAKQNGMDAVRFCRTLCAREFLDFDTLWPLAHRRIETAKREKRDRRNAAIREKAKRPGMKQERLARIFKLSEGQISKILSENPPCPICGVKWDCRHKLGLPAIAA